MASANQTGMYINGILLTLLLAFSVTSRAGIDYLETSAYESDKAAQGLLLDIVNTGKHLIAVGERGHILYSADQGTNWLQASVPVYVTLTAVFFITPDKGWAVGHEGVILHTTDAGKTWVRQLDGYQINKQVLKQAQQLVNDRQEQLDAITDEKLREEAVYQLEEAGYLLEEAIEDDRAGPAKPLLDVWFADENHGFVVGAYGILLQTLDGGTSWKLVSNRLDNQEGFHLNAITATGSETIFITGESGSIFRSTDSGSSWTRLESPYQGSYFGLVNPGKYLLVYGLRGNVYRSEDNGDSWLVVDTNVNAALSSGVITRSGMVVLVGSAGHVVYSNDEGNSFSVKVREDRLSLSAITEITDNQLLAVGVQGIHKVEADVLSRSR